MKTLYNKKQEGGKMKDFLWVLAYYIRGRLLRRDGYVPKAVSGWLIFSIPRREGITSSRLRRLASRWRRRFPNAARENLYAFYIEPLK